MNSPTTARMLAAARAERKRKRGGRPSLADVEAVELDLGLLVDRLALLRLRYLIGCGWKVEEKKRLVIGRWKARRADATMPWPYDWGHDVKKGEPHPAQTYPVYVSPLGERYSSLPAAFHLERRRAVRSGERAVAEFEVDRRGRVRRVRRVR